MAVFSGPEIVNDGLVLQLDAANPRSLLSAVEYLIVAGGGGGGGTGAGGAGAGGLLTDTTSVTPQGYTIAVGTGGAAGRSWNNSPNAGTNGGNSSAFGLTAIGGGKSSRNGSSGGPSNGGSGAGGDRNIAPGQGTAGQGNRGGFAPFGNGQGTGGGGGAGSVGQAAVSTSISGNGGVGLALNITGTATFYAGGGGGGIYGTSRTAGIGGLGGGGAGGNTNVANTGTGARDGTPNTGGGGGGGGYTSSGANLQGGGVGGSGIVIVRYPGPQRATGGTVTSVNGDTVHTFTTSGTFTPNIMTNLSGNGNNGTLVNGVGYSSADNGSLVFDGVDDYVVALSPGSYSNYTFAFFCRWNAPVTFNRIFGLSNFGTYTILSPTNVGFHYNPAGGSPPSVTLSSNVNVGYGTWCYIAVTVNSSTSLVTIYINGVSRNNWGVLPSGNFSGNLYLGAQNTQNLVSNCNMGFFSLYNRALTAQEVAQNFEAMRDRYDI